ncbi:hypothetical protein CU048_07995 [Beijerinckiaceae bacterium]|nr:hypothetical protein CU048_07995 [Beijerinckiaceae bacterium]
MSDRLVGAVTGFAVENDAQWLALSQRVPGVSYFATDLDPRSFEKSETDGIWLGRAELLLSAPADIRVGQAQHVSFTMPVRVELFESGGEFSVKAFDFYSAEESEAPPAQFDPDEGPPKRIGWGPFEGLINE